MKYFLIDGYWKDNKSEFNSYLVTDTDDYNEEEDDNIFFYGLSENDIREAIKEGENNALEFVITDYREVK